MNPMNPFSGSDLLEDAEPLRLSSHGDGVDGFDFDFKDNPLFSDERTSRELDRALGASDMDIPMDLGDLFQAEPEATPMTSDGIMHFESMQDQEATVISNGSSHGCGVMVHNVSLGSFPQDQGLQVRPSGYCSDNTLNTNAIQASAVDFDSMPSNRPCPPRRQQRRASCGDLNASPAGLSQLLREISVDSGPALVVPGVASDAPPPRPQRRVTLDSLAALESNHVLRGDSVGNFGDSAPNDVRGQEQTTTTSFDKAMYREAVRKFAQSMRRTELSRRQLRMLGVPTLRLQAQPGAQAQPLPQPQVRPPTKARRRRKKSAAARRQPLRRAGTDPGAAKGDALQGPARDRASNAADFFSGKRGTLTDGLEHSRRQLKMYGLAASRISQCS